MSISNELSSDVASALLTTRTRSSERLDHLKRTVLLVHEVLQNLDDSENKASTERSLKRELARNMKRDPAGGRSPD